MSFAAKHGQGLEEFAYDGYMYSCVSSFLDMCPNLRKIDIDIGWFLDDLNDTLVNTSLNKLEVIRGIIIDGEESNGLKDLLDTYGTSLKGLKLIINFRSSDKLKTCFAHISRFESLKSLELEIEIFLTFEPIDGCIEQLADKCTKLRELRIKTKESSIISNRFFFALSDFRSLGRLVLDLKNATNKLERSVECLKHMTRLKHLSIKYSELSEDFFANIPMHLPNMRYLNLKFIPEDSIKPFVESLQTMKCIERVVINSTERYFRIL